MVTTNGRDLNRIDIEKFPLVISKLLKNTKKKLSILAEELMGDYMKNKQEKEKTSKKTGHILYEEFYPRESKSIIDKIDNELASALGLTEKELDYINNFEYVYRLGVSNIEEYDA